MTKTRETPKAECHRLATELGATVRTSGGRYFECTAEAPQGSVWKATGTHEVVSCSDPPWVLPAQCWQALAVDMRPGVEPCEVSDCEVCHPED